MVMSGGLVAVLGSLAALLLFRGIKLENAYHAKVNDMSAFFERRCIVQSVHLFGDCVNVTVMNRDRLTETAVVQWQWPQKHNYTVCHGATIPTTFQCYADPSFTDVFPVKGSTPSKLRLMVVFMLGLISLGMMWAVADQI